MIQGLQCFDANGHLILDVTDRMTRVLGEFETGATNGSHVDDALLDGTPWMYFYNLTDQLGWQRIPIHIYASGNTIYWEFQPTGAKYQTIQYNRKVIYGVC